MESKLNSRLQNVWRHIHKVPISVPCYLENMKIDLGMFMLTKCSELNPQKCSETMIFFTPGVVKCVTLKITLNTQCM